MRKNDDRKIKIFMADVMIENKNKFLYSVYRSEKNNIFAPNSRTQFIWIHKCLVHDIFFHVKVIKFCIEIINVYTGNKHFW